MSLRGPYAPELKRLPHELLSAMASRGKIEFTRGSNVRVCGARQIIVRGIFKEQASSHDHDPHHRRNRRERRVKQCERAPPHAHTHLEPQQMAFVFQFAVRSNYGCE